VARLPYLNASDLAVADRPLLARGINLHRALAHSPNGLRHQSGLGSYIRHKSRLDPRVRELAIIQVGYLARSRYEFSHHIKFALEFGVPEADIRASLEECEGKPTGLEPKLRVSLRAAREIYDDLSPSDETFAALSAVFDKECLVDLIITICFYCGVVRELESLRIDVEPEYEVYLKTFPLPPAASHGGRARGGT
jgi:alkylhydroperoxidase family enzyme